MSGERSGIRRGRRGDYQTRGIGGTHGTDGIDGMHGELGMRGWPSIIAVLCVILFGILVGSHEVSAQGLEEPATELAAEPTIFVRGFRFEGNTLISDHELAGLLEPMTGKALTLIDLHTATLAIKLHYQTLGYFLVEAIVPPQEIIDGVVEIRIVEGRYGQVVLHNESRLRDSVARAFLQPMVPGEVVTAGPYERATLLLSEIPGVETEAFFSPGSEVGTADLHVMMQDGAYSTGEVAFGFSAENPAQDASVMWSVHVNNPAGLADELGVSFGVAGGSRNLGVSYTLPTGSGLSVGLEYKASRQEVGGVFAPLDIETWAHNVTVSLGYALQRSPAADRTLDLSFEHISSGRDILGIMTKDARHRLSAGVSGRNSVGQDRRIQYAVQGTLGMSLPGSGFRLAYSKLNGTYSDMRQLAPGTQVNGSVDAQLALSELDASERLELGGPGGVRAYAAGIPGDSGIVGRLQASQVLGWVPLPGIVQASGYLEGGGVWLRNPDPGGAAFQQRYGFGVGVIWAFPRGGALQLDRAWPIALSGDHDVAGKLWIRLVLRY